MTQAARQLNLSTAAVSGGISRVEEQLGLRLFERTTRTLRTTSQGHVVIDGCRAMLETWRQTLEGAQEQHAGLRGDVRLSAPSDTVYGLLGNALATFVTQHPHVRLALDISDAIAPLQRDGIDIAIRYGTLADSGLVAQRLASQPTVLVASASYLSQAGTPKTVPQLDQHRLLCLRLSGHAHLQWRLQQGKRKHTVQLPGSLVADGHQVRQWALAGHGIALKHLMDVVEDLQAGRLVQVLPDVHGGQVPIHAVFPSKSGKTARVVALHHRVQEVFDARTTRCQDWRQCG